ncbi:hypothetical protein J437_LFUL010624 [Ladona fulva]|uniref:Uncharacterized protein n=1 Tax=Ladona fulva TaxID=123851 RepID=A0A8K0K841_LADFU|nr:hypothetical protein J437_LFUL010624 [Ladona fulva]
MSYKVRKYKYHLLRAHVVWDLFLKRETQKNLLGLKNVCERLRVPFLRVGWNRQFSMMREFGFVYDASIAAPFSDPPLWPYTLDHRMPHICVGGSGNQRCPTRPQPGIWEMVMNQLEIEPVNLLESPPEIATSNGPHIYIKRDLPHPRRFIRKVSVKAAAG